MKKKIFLAVIAVLVLCLTCGMLLVACNDDKPNPDDDIDTPVVPPEEDLSAADALAEIVQNLDEVATDTTGDKEFNFGIEIVDKGNGGNVIFGLATEKYDGKDYLYGAINGPYKKFNGFDLGATVSAPPCRRSSAGSARTSRSRSVHFWAAATRPSYWMQRMSSTCPPLLRVWCSPRM